MFLKSILNSNTCVDLLTLYMVKKKKNSEKSSAVECLMIEQNMHSIFECSMGFQKLMIGTHIQPGGG